MPRGRAHVRAILLLPAGDGEGGGRKALSAGDGDPVAQNGWQGTGEDEPGAGGVSSSSWLPLRPRPGVTGPWC